MRLLLQQPLTRPPGIEGYVASVGVSTRTLAAVREVHGVRRSRDQARVWGSTSGDAGSIHFFEPVRLDYVSGSSYRVPVARLAAGRAALATHPDLGAPSDLA